MGPLYDTKWVECCVFYSTDIGSCFHTTLAPQKIHLIEWIHVWRWWTSEAAMTYLSHSTNVSQNNVAGGPICSLNNKNAAFLTTYCSIHTSSTYICPSKLPSQSISVIIQRKPGPKRQDLRDIVRLPRVLKIARRMTSLRVFRNWPISERLYVTSSGF